MARLKPVRFEDRMTLVEHLDELRNRIIVSLVAFGVAFGLCFWQDSLMLDIANSPLPDDRPLVTLSPVEPFFTTVEVSAYGAAVLALPIILYQFGNLSLIAPLANILLVPVVPYTMLLGTVALIAGLIWLPFGQWLALAVWLPLSWLTEGARLLAQVPWAAVQLPPFPLWLLLGHYIIVVGGWLWNAAEDTTTSRGA
jgi:hypothetical protein